MLVIETRAGLLFLPAAISYDQNKRLQHSFPKILLRRNTAARATEPGVDKPVSTILPLLEYQPMPETISLTRGRAPGDPFNRAPPVAPGE